MHHSHLLRAAGALIASLALLAGMPAQAADAPAQAGGDAPKAKAATKTAKAKKAATETECVGTGGSKDDGSNNPNGKKPSGPKCPEMAGKIATPAAK